VLFLISLLFAIFILLDYKYTYLLLTWQRYNYFPKEKRFFIEMLFPQGLQGFVPFRMAQYAGSKISKSQISNLKTKIHFEFKISSKLINIIIYYNILLY